eukprot:scaffold70040_cov48-Phaeocystis_antarctica.AAC.2
MRRVIPFYSLTHSLTTSYRAGPLARGAEEATSLRHRARQPVPPAALTTDAPGRGGSGRGARRARARGSAPLLVVLASCSALGGAGSAGEERARSKVEWSSSTS